MLKWLATRFEQRRADLQARLETSIRQTSPDLPPLGPEDWRQRGNEALDAGDLAAAARCYQNALDLAPSDVAALVNLAFAKSEQHLREEARVLLDRALSLDAMNIDAWYMLGGIRERDQNFTGAASALRKVIELRPDFELAYRDLCRVLFQSGELQSAKSTILTGLTLNPTHADFHFYLGNVRFFEADYVAATASFEKTLLLQPDYAQAYVNLGKILQKQQQFDAALAAYQKALELQPENAEFHNHVGNLFLLRGMPHEAIVNFQRAIAIEPSDAEAHLNMGSALIDTGDSRQAVDYCRSAIRLRPDIAQAHNVLGIALDALGQTQQALAAFTEALKINPELLSALCNVGSVRLAEGRLEDAIHQYGRALRADPANEAANGNLLFALNYHPDLPAAEIFAAYQRFDQIVAAPLRPTWRHFSNLRSTQRRLRIGYVSPDLRNHTVMRFLEPVLASHDAQGFEVFAYAELVHEDAVTARAKSMVAHWRSTTGRSDEAVAELIRDDRIDILVDIAGHTAGNRLRVFARNPAPVSVSWLGYGYTTGLSAIDYYLTDAFAAPPGEEHLFSEKPWRMPKSSWVYRPETGMGQAGPLPAASCGYITFGTLTRPVRINHRVVRVWAEILMRVPHSRLVVDSKSYADATTCDALIAQFVAHGIGRERLRIGYHSPPWDLMRSIDISLDCFPHNSGTTLFESLYMGVPFVTLAGRPSVGRLGATILHGLGQSAWITDSEEAYVEAAVKLAQDLDGLARVRSSLRGQMEQSCLMDEIGFTRELEQAYRSMLEAWAARARDADPEKR